MNKGMFSSNKPDWGTPWSFFNKLDKEFGFTIDVCAHDGNKKCDNYFSEQDDALLRPWYGICWMNPPYGRKIGLWVKKAFYESRKEECVVVCLLPSRTDTKWWSDYVMKSSEIRFVKGRLRFDGARASAPFPSAVVVFDGKSEVLSVKTMLK